MNRILPFQGTHNFRDMGGYRTTDGRTVKPGLFFRSDELTALSEQDLTAFQALKIRTIFDFRDGGEARHKPDPAVAGVQNIRISAIPEEQLSRMNLPGAMQSQERSAHFIEDLVNSGFFKQFRANAYLLEMYAKLPINNPAYKRLMSLIQCPDNLGAPSSLHGRQGPHRRRGRIDPARARRSGSDDHGRLPVDQSDDESL